APVPFRPWLPEAPGVLRRPRRSRATAPAGCRLRAGGTPERTASLWGDKIAGDIDDDVARGAGSDGEVEDALGARGGGFGTYGDEDAVGNDVAASIVERARVGGRRAPRIHEQVTGGAREHRDDIDEGAL